MRVVGIIAEFNPFHNGHRYLVDQVKSTLNPDAVVAIMSGNFVQRGEPAMWNKWIRAKCAIENGIDLVFELPVCFAANSAEEFARGAIRTLRRLNLITDLAFGSETGDKENLIEIATLLSSEDDLFSKYLKEALNLGMSYPSAYEKAFRLRFDEYSFPHNILKGSNDILAMEYLKQIYLQKAAFDIFPVKRKGMGHDCGHSVIPYASASIIRKQVREDLSLAAVKIALPKETYDNCNDEHFLTAADEGRYYVLIRNALLNKNKRELASLLSISEGLENRLKESLIHADTLDELIMLTKSKRYTYAKISRTLVHAVLGITKGSYEKFKSTDFAYGRVLALNSTGSSILRILQDGVSDIPIYTNLSNSIKDNSSEESMLSLDCLASDIYSIIAGQALYNGSDFVNRPYVSFL